METYGYGNGIVFEDIELGKTYHFGQLVEGDENLQELLDSKCVAIYDEYEEEWKACEFEILEENENLLDTIIKVTDTHYY